MSRKFRVVDGCPAPELIAPYIAIITKGLNVNSIYRGDDAAEILHAHGKHTQAELYQGWVHHQPGYYPANPPGRSTHELRGDGTAYGARVGAKLEDWQCGFDVNDSDVPKIIGHAAHLGWHVYQPYRSGSEYHHLNFRVRPGPNEHVSAQQIKDKRRRLPTR